MDEYLSTKSKGLKERQDSKQRMIGWHYKLSPFWAAIVTR